MEIGPALDWAIMATPFLLGYLAWLIYDQFIAS